MGFDEHATKLIAIYLIERTQKIVLYGMESDWINLKEKFNKVLS